MQALKTAAMFFLYEQLRRKMSPSPMKTDNTAASVIASTVFMPFCCKVYKKLAP
jgi:hypothetical protein